MGIGSMLLDGLKAMVLGMVMVYSFLIIMIFLMKLMSKALAPYANALVKQAPAKKKAGPAPAAKKNALSAEEVILAKAAIAAVKQYRGE